MVCSLFTAAILALTATPSSAQLWGNPAFYNHFGIPGNNATFDYVVVGGGTAGLAVAMRLAENGTLSVAVVEAGGFYELENGNLTSIPGNYVPNSLAPAVDWSFTTTAQPALADQTFPYARGKTLGGSSALNAMIYQRGTTQSYQLWADRVGDASYTFDNLLPFFQRSAHYTPPNTFLRAANASVPAPSSEAYAPFGGPLQVTHTNYAAPFSSWGQLALDELGVPSIRDFSSGNLLGSQYAPLTVVPEYQTRGSSEATYLRSALETRQYNLKVYTHSLAKRILFDDNKTATGVLVETANVSYTLSATREIVVSAGAFQSPQLLMASGIGPSEVLNHLEIPIVADLPGVGQNMQDHVLFGTVYEVNVDTTARLMDPVFNAEATRQYLTNNAGILASNNADYIGWEKLPAASFANLSADAQAWLSSFPADWPDFEFVIGSFTPFSYMPQNTSYGFVEVALITPRSRGNISISSSDTSVPPLINVGWLSSPTDRELAIQAVKRGRAVFNAASMQPVLVGGEVVPGPAVHTDADIEAFVLKNPQTVYHASCTCAMGMANDTMTVVDSRARVFGVRALRVVDASSFPLLVPGHPQSTIYALAEKIAADMLLRG